jgi:hypothetical protein
MQLFLQPSFNADLLQVRRARCADALGQAIQHRQIARRKLGRGGRSRDDRSRQCCEHDQRETRGRRTSPDLGCSHAFTPGRSRAASSRWEENTTQLNQA